MVTKKYDKIITLGSDCTIVESHKKYGKIHSYPFDWNVSVDLSGVVDALHTDFKEYTKVYTRIIEEPKDLPDKETRINKYNIGFVHYDKIPLEEFEKIFNRRIERFRFAIENNSVLFVRSEHVSYRLSKNNCNSSNIKNIEKLRKYIKFLNKNHGNRFHCVVIITCDGCRKKYNNVPSDENITIYNNKSKINGNMSGIDVYDKIIKKYI